MTRRPLTPDDVARAIAVAAESVAADGRAARALAASFAIRAAAVEALIEVGATAEPLEALRLAGLAGEADALKVGFAMSSAAWEPRLARVLARILGLLLPGAPALRTIARPDPPADLTAALMGDPPRARSAAPERRAA